MHYEQLPASISLLFAAQINLSTTGSNAESFPAVLKETDRQAISMHLRPKGTVLSSPDYILSILYFLDKWTHTDPARQQWFNTQYHGGRIWILKLNLEMLHLIQYFICYLAQIISKFSWKTEFWGGRGLRSSSENKQTCSFLSGSERLIFTSAFILRNK